MNADIRETHAGHLPRRWATLVLVATVVAGTSQSVDTQRMADAPRTLMTFSGAAAEPTWVAVNDDVMGGVSEGRPTIADGQLRFAGTLSLENNGGFSSVRTTGRAFDFSGAKAMMLRVQGDGRTYQLRLATDARVRRSAIAYSAEFPTTAGQWTEVRIPFDTLVPTYRGTRLDGPPLDLSKVEEIRLLIGDGRGGPFTLAVDWIKVDGQAPANNRVQPTAPGAMMSRRG